MFLTVRPENSEHAKALRHGAVPDSVEVPEAARKSTYPRLKRCEPGLTNILAISVQELSYSKVAKHTCQDTSQNKRRNYPIPSAWLGDAPSTLVEYGTANKASLFRPPPPPYTL
jgi:hypothetical protein